MGDNIYLGDRNGVRTPMQWSTDRNGGFSRADPQRPVSAADHGSDLRLPSVNVEAQAASRRRCSTGRDASSRCGKPHQCVRPRHARAPAPAATARSSRTSAATATRAMLCVANLSRSAQAVELDLRSTRAACRSSCWAARVPADRRAAVHADACPATASIGSSSRIRAAAELARGAARDRGEALARAIQRARQLQVDARRTSCRRREAARAARARSHPELLRAQRWFAGKGAGAAAVKIDKLGRWQPSEECGCCCSRGAEFLRGAARVFLPLALDWGDAGGAARRPCARARTSTSATGATCSTRSRTRLRAHLVSAL